jgi:hypothetical protein
MNDGKARPNDKVGQGNFNCVDSRKSGLQVVGQVKDIAQIKSGDKIYFLFLRNDDYPVMYQVNSQ